MKDFKRLDLQFFAEGEGGGGDDGAGAGEEGAGSNETLSFDDFLSQGGNQAEFDRRVQKAINTAVSNAQKKWKTLTDDQVSEAEKLAQMTAEEKEKYRADKAERELNDLKRQITLGNMAKTARKMLSDESISVSDDIIMNLVSDDAEKTKTTVQEFAHAFKVAVQDGVKEALRGNPPKAGGDDPKPMTREEILNIKDRRERREQIAKHPELFV